MRDRGLFNFCQVVRFGGPSEFADCREDCRTQPRKGPHPAIIIVHAANRNSAFFWLCVSLYELVSKHIIIVKFDISSVTLLLPYNFQNYV